MRIVQRKNTKYSDTYEFFILESPPTKRSYEFQGKYYFLQFPWMYFVATKAIDSKYLDQVAVLGNTKKAKDFLSPLYIMPIAHHNQVSMCAGTLSIDQLEYFIFTNNIYYAMEYPQLYTKYSAAILNVWEQRGFDVIENKTKTNIERALRDLGVPAVDNYELRDLGKFSVDSFYKPY